MPDFEISLEDPGSRAILIEAGLFSSDPSSVAGLCERIDVNSGVDPNFQPIPYDTRHTTRQKVRCSVCASRVWHNSGFIVKNGTGQLGLVGWECGESQLFGEGGWQAMVNRTERAQKDALYRFRWKPAQDAATKMAARMSNWAELALQVDHEQVEFDLTFPDLLAAMSSKMDSGTLSITRMMRRPYIAPDGSQRTRSEPVREVVVRTRAAWFFRGRTLSKRIISARRKLTENSQKLSADCSSDEISQIRMGFRAAKDTLAECLDMQQSLKELQTKDLWKAIAKWALHEQVKPGHFKVRGGALVAEDRSYDYNYQLPTFPLDELQKAGLSVDAGWPSI